MRVYPRPRWAGKLLFYVTDDWYDRLELRGVPDGTWPWVWRAEVSDAVVWLLCKGLGHLATPDQCGKPEHYFCTYCRKLMPQAVEL